MRAPVTGDRTEFANYETGCFGRLRFVILEIDAVVADLGSGHSDYLAVVGGVCYDLLIASHTSVENAFTEDSL